MSLNSYNKMYFSWNTYVCIEFKEVLTYHVGVGLSIYKTSCLFSLVLYMKSPFEVPCIHIHIIRFINYLSLSFVSDDTI